MKKIIQQNIEIFKNEKDSNEWLRKILIVREFVENETIEQAENDLESRKALMLEFLETELISNKNYKPHTAEEIKKFLIEKVEEN